MNNKGFTMVEIIATIALIGILASIAAVGVSRYKTKAVSNDYEALAKASYDAMEEYMMTHPYETKVSLETLEKEKLLSNRIDPGSKENDCTGTVIVDSNDGTDGKMDNGTYTVNLCCVTKQNTYTYPDGKVKKLTDKSKCEYVPEEPTPEPTPEPREKVKCNAGYYLPAKKDKCSKCTKGNYCIGGEWYIDEFIDQGLTPCPTGYTSEEGISTKNNCYINVNAGKYIKTNNSSTQTLCSSGTYKEEHKVYYGNKSECRICPQGYNHSSEGSKVKSDCFMKVPKNKYVKIERDNNSTKCEQGYTSAKHNVYYGKKSKCSTKPTCTIIATTQPNAKGWYNDDVIIKLNVTEDVYDMGLDKTPGSHNNKKTAHITTNGTTKYYGYVRNSHGSGECSLVIKIDKERPSISFDKVGKIGDSQIKIDNTKGTVIKNVYISDYELTINNDNVPISGVDITSFICTIEKEKGYGSSIDGKYQITDISANKKIIKPILRHDKENDSLVMRVNCSATVETGSGLIETKTTSDLIGNGWLKENGQWYYYSSGEKIEGWAYLYWYKGNSTGFWDWYYFYKGNETSQKNYCNGEGRAGQMATGWCRCLDTTKNNGKYPYYNYFVEDGGVVSLPESYGGKMTSVGSMIHSGEATIRGTKYNFDRNGFCISGPGCGKLNC